MTAPDSYNQRPSIKACACNGQQAERIRELEADNERLQKCREDSMVSEANVIRQRDEARSLIGQIPPSMIRNMSAPLRDALMRHGAKVLMDEREPQTNLSGLTRTELLEGQRAKLHDLCRLLFKQAETVKLTDKTAKYRYGEPRPDGKKPPVGSRWLTPDELISEALLAEAREMLGGGE